MSSIFNQKLFLVKEVFSLLKFEKNFDIFNPETGEKILTCRESNLALSTKFMRLSEYKGHTPFDIEITNARGEKVISIQKNESVFLAKIKVLDEQNNIIGFLKPSLASLGCGFYILDSNENKICELNGEIFQWRFIASHRNIKFAQITKKWAGVGKELLTNADNYIISIGEDIAHQDNIVKLILTSAICIDMVFR